MMSARKYLFVKRVDPKNLRDKHTFSASALLIPVFHLHLSFEVKFIKENVNETFYLRKTSYL